MAYFSPGVEKDLMECGWYPGRSIDTEPYRQSAIANNLPYHETADAFLREFGGLHVGTTAYADRSGSFVVIWLEPAEIIADIDADDVRDEIYAKSKRLNKNLTFIGEVGEVLLFMADDGAVYGSYSNTMFVGEDGHAALERLMSRGGPLREIYTR